MKNIETKGITLIALITVVIMLILAGVVISLTIGENTLIKKINSNNVQKYTQEEIRKKVETAITNTLEKERVLGNDITIASILQELVENDIFESIDKEVGIGNIQEYQIKLKEDASNIVIEDIRKVAGTRITYKLEPKGYTNSEKVSILFKVEGKVKSITKPDGLVIYPNKEKIAIDYEVDKNGKYPFTIENEDGTSITKHAIVDTIDKLSPLDFEITAKMNGTTLTISHEVKDSPLAEESVCSGIERYEYFIKGTNNDDYKLYNTNNIENLTLDTYFVYVIAYDKAGNHTSSSVKTVLPASTLLYNSNNPDISQWEFIVEKNVKKYGIYNNLMTMDSYALSFGIVNGVWQGGKEKGTATTKQLYDLSQYTSLTVKISDYAIVNELIIGVVDENEEWIIQKTPNKSGELILDLKNINQLGRLRIYIDNALIYISRISLD